VHNGHFAKFNLIVFKKLITDNHHYKCNQFPWITMKLTYLFFKILPTDNSHHKCNQFFL